MSGKLPPEADDRIAAALPLHNVRVVEFSHMVMGPTCGLILADLGADVIKIEPAGDGDKTRKLTGSGAGFFPTYNRNKRSVAVDVKSQKGLQFARRLINGADVLIENFRPGGLAALGLGYETLKATNPRLIYYSAKGFLPGPYDNRTALDEVVQMMGGLAYMTGPPGQPLRAGASVNDVMGGMFGVIGILAALRQRDQTGEGAEVVSSLFENCAFLCGQHMVQYAVTGQPANPMPARLSAWAVYDVFDCADGEQVFVGVVSDTQWERFCADFGLDHLSKDPALQTNPQRCHARDRFLPEIRALFGRMTHDAVMQRCETLGLPHAPIRKPEDLYDDPHLQASGGLLDVGLPDGKVTQVPGLPVVINGQRTSVRRDIPAIGAHSVEVAREAGLSETDIARMIDDGILSDAMTETEAG
jgi:crotonobetainyl-CoA:carnitine CoA-transferase CaiB-like acyl-CoA transferase